MAESYFKIKVVDVPNNPLIQKGSVSFDGIDCIASAVKADLITQLASKGTPLTKAAAIALRQQWDDDFPEPS